jgi:two-component system sensor histidine kinase HydH
VIRRLPPLAIAFALMAAALVATVLATRHTVNDATGIVANGQVFAVEQAVRADLFELEGPPSSADLATLLADHSADGARYIGLRDPRGDILAEAGAAEGTYIPRQPRAGGPERPRSARSFEIDRVGSRLRIETRITYRRGWTGPRNVTLALEVEPVEAEELRAASQRTIWIAGLAALTLLGVAVALVRRQLRRQAEERDRERERRLASLGEMSAVLAHEIKNPLASLKGNAQLLAAALPEGEKPRAKAQRVVDEAVRLELLIEDLLAFVRTGTIDRAPYDPVALAREAAAAVQGEVEVRAGQVAPFALDGNRIREVLVNLMDNAIAAGPPVVVTVAVEQGWLIYEVRDHGAGVPIADRDKIFEPFHTGKTRGTGLGLAIAKRLVELHRGTISVEDAPGGGARFRIAIPEA